jgi:hypothetical protein
MPEINAIINQLINYKNMHPLSGFVYDCFLTTRNLGVNPALNLDTDLDGSGSGCFMSCGSTHRSGSAGSWPASDVGPRRYLVQILIESPQTWLAPAALIRC